MNRLPLAKQVQIINMLVEGSSLRSTSRVCDVSINTVTKCCNLLTSYYLCPVNQQQEP